MHDIGIYGLENGDAIHLLHDASLDSFVNGAFFATPMYHDMGETWRLTLYTLYYICCT